MSTIGCNFCIAPFIQLQISNEGKTGPCPYTANMWKLESHETIKDKWQSKTLENFRNSFIKNEQNELCKRCWKEEDAGKLSLRKRLNNFKKTTNLQEKIFQKYVEKKEYFEYPKIITLIPGNECNLACPTCGPNFSSKWNSLIKNGNYKNLQTNKNWNLKEEQYQDIVDNSKKIQKIELFGGEPFYNKKNKQLLIDQLIKKGTSKNIVLYFNTNGTIFDEDYLKTLCKNFKKLEIRLSMDGIYKQFEYLRYGAKFNEVIKNAESFNRLSNTDFEIICSVSPYNFLYLDEYDAFFKAKKWSVFYNIVSHPNRMMLYHLPEEIKTSINLTNKFAEVEAFIKNTKSDPDAWADFVNYTKILDKNRSIQFKDAFPKLYNRVRSYGFE